MFENLTNKFEEIFSSLKKAPSLNEVQVDEGLRSIRQALLEADVSLDVAKEFIEKETTSTKAACSCNCFQCKNGRERDKVLAREK